MNPKNVYIIGKVVGSSRTQNLIKFLLDQNYNVHYNSISLNFSYARGFKGIFISIFNIIFRFVEFVLKLYFLIISDTVILPAMCNSHQVELLIASFFRKNIITDFYISFYDTFVLDYGQVSSESSKAKLKLYYDYNIIKKASFTLFLNITEANRYLKLVNIPFDSSKHLVVPLVIEEELKCDLSYYNSNLNNSFNVCWWGNYIPLHGLEKIINACKILNENYNIKFHLYLFGTDDQKGQKYVDLIAELGLNKLITIDNNSTFKNGKLGNFLKNHCDLVLGNFGDSEKAKNVLVNKLIDGVAMKCPVLTGESVAPLEFFSENEIFYTLNQPFSIADKIYEISNESKFEINCRVTKAYKIYKNKFTVKAYYSAMASVINKIQ